MKQNYFFLLLIIFLLSATGYCFAANLEINYPALPGADALTSSSLLPSYFYYIYIFLTIAGFLIVSFSVAFSGFLYLISISLPSKRAEAKSRLSSAMLGLVLLLLTYLILTTINPALSIFKITDLLKAPPQPASAPMTGVYLFENPNCALTLTTSGSEIPYLSSVADFGPLKNKISSTMAVSDPNIDIYFDGFLFDEKNYYGKCQELLNGSSNVCHNVSPFAASASIFRLDHSGGSGKITFYRNPFYNEKGGYFTIDAFGIGQYYLKRLDEIEFKDPSATSSDKCTVPKEDQDCTSWDLEGTCLQRKCPNLSNGNINSIQISGGKYFILLVYFDENVDNEYGPWTFCQGFPTDKDRDKSGPRQIKWEPSKTQGTLPNYILIYPIE